MACGSCGGQAVGAAVRGFDPSDLPWIDVNVHGVRPMGDDAVNCPPYHGAYLGTSVFVVGYGTEYERIYLRSRRVEAWEFATTNELTFQHVNCTEFCHDRIAALFGEAQLPQAVDEVRPLESVKQA